MAIRRVFVIWTHPLFYESVRRLLQHPDIEWAGATSDRASIQAQLVSLCPDTVLLEEETNRDTAAEVLRILGANSTATRLIQLNLTENELTIYHREQKTVRQADDLLRLIQEQ
jgi:DNA-binding NarL/FixJ family response regulator